MSNHEQIEWCDIWVTKADSGNCKRVLLIGDSIVRSYFPRVNAILTDKFSCARLATSKCVCDPTFQNELKLVLNEYEFTTTHLNNGLHGWAYDEDCYRQGIADTIDFITHSTTSTLVWANTTPVWRKDIPGQLDPKTKRVQERNRIAMEICSNRDIPVNDLYTLMFNYPQYFSKDGIHFNEDGQNILGEQVARFILEQS